MVIPGFKIWFNSFDGMFMFCDTGKESAYQCMCCACACMCTCVNAYVLVFLIGQQQHYGA